MLSGMHSSHINIIVISFLHVHIVLGAGPISKGITVSTWILQRHAGQEFLHRMVDGIAIRAPGSCQCCTYSAYNYEPFYNVDLGKEYNITRVDVIGRGGPEDSYDSGHTLKNLQVRYKTSTTKFKTLFYNPDRIYVVRHNLSSPLPMRFLHLKLVKIYMYFTICELFVYAKCNNGTYGNNCDDCGHCLNDAICDIEDGACVSCEAGFKGARCDQNCSAGEYGIDCAETCGFCKNRDVCDRMNGSCIECQDGFMLPYCKDCVDYKFGENCTKICQHCAEGPCNKTSGACQSGGCKEGYEGVKCDTECNRTYGFNCNETCGSCYNNTACNRFNGSCPQSHCAAGFRGDKCKQACMSGSYGQNCSETCGNCTNGETCDSITGMCLHGCSNGYNGSFCKTKCPSGTFGKNCNSTCGNCINGDVCRFDNGHCERECEPGFQPPTCVAECSAGRFGANCSENCGSCYNNAACDVYNGNCPFAYCEPGFRGLKCELNCTSGSYGQNCSETCGNCTNGEICDFVTGVCLYGCSEGYNGTLCKTTCQSGTFGKDCNSTCGNCINGDVCRFDNGYCEKGCEQGFQLPTCLNRVTEPEPSSNLSTEEIAGSAAGGIFIIGLILVGVIIVCRHRLKNSREEVTERRNGSNEENNHAIHMDSPSAVTSDESGPSWYSVDSQI